MTALKSFSPKNFTPLLEIKVLCLRWDFYRFPLGFSIYANKGGGGRGLQGFFSWKVNFNFTHIYLSLISCICGQKNLSPYQKLNFCSYWGTLNLFQLNFDQTLNLFQLNSDQTLNLFQLNFDKTLNLFQLNFDHISGRFTDHQG